MQITGAEQVKHTHFDIADANPAAEVVAAVTGKRIRVLSFVITTATAGEVKFQDRTGPTVLTSFHLAANGGVSYAGGVNSPAFETDAGEALDVLHSALAGEAAGFVTFIEV